ncbi:hypothetical protein CWB96_05490 [Pseudoalteromonas citrea]|uniref:Uncharacterized protein n=1 Tax=Pseudoalteromonas citrea TaxID=43655 RepID=A0A5S3XU41_9GAMM|nr:hypothetical protein CWB97_10465 [Pseudoalteromonas citrea]TMP61076.1 hypothetical protein CWB96_05490 [Pseudoalteromonas citrea]
MIDYTKNLTGNVLDQQKETIYFKSTTYRWHLEKTTNPHQQALLNNFKFPPDLMSRFNRKAPELLFISYLKNQLIKHFIFNRHYQKNTKTNLNQ